MKKCPKCGKEWPDSANFCPGDGTDMRPVAPLAEPTVEDDTDAYPDGDENSPDEELELDQQRRAGFSETQWFMVAQDPEKLKEAPSNKELLEMQDDYDWDEEIPEEQRARFSLRGDKKKKDEGDW
jgi:hypothetical protein